MPAKVKKSTKPKKTVKTPPKAKPVEEPVVAPAPAPEPVETMDEEVDTFMIYSQINDMRTKLKMLTGMCREVMTELTSLEKQVNKDKKFVDRKLKKKNKSTNGTKVASVFETPGEVSKKLRDFMGLTEGQLVARVDVTKFITKYCKENELCSKEDKRIIVPDKKLKGLLNVTDDVQLTYFNLQKYLKYHFPNKDGVYQTQ